MSDDPILLTPAPKRPEPLICIPHDEDQARGYSIGLWKGHFNYECLSCQYATLWEEKMIAHVLEGTHPWSFSSGTSHASDDKLTY